MDSTNSDFPLVGVDQLLPVTEFPSLVDDPELDLDPYLHGWWAPLCRRTDRREYPW